MARSKSGGTRSFLRGRVGADVYSIGKDAKGKKQQVVRSLAESVANPQTLAQMRGRMIMSTVMQAVSSMSQIIDHSFDNVSVGQPNVSEFIRRNYAAIKADVSAHPAEGNAFGLAMYGEKGIKQGTYIVSAGSALPAKGIVVDGAAKTLAIALSAGATIADLRSALGLGVNDYFTAVAITADKKFVFVRFHVATTLADSTAISAQNIGEVISTDGNINVSLAFANNTVTATFGAFSANYGIIVSRKENAIYKHNDCVLVAVADPAYTSDTALPTYPVGTQRFLNGGGEDQGQVEPEPEPAQPISIKSWTFESETLTGATVSRATAFGGNKQVTANANGQIGSDTYKFMRNSSKSLTGATAMNSISAFPATCDSFAYSAETYVMVVKNDTEIIGSFDLYSGGNGNGNITPGEGD